MTTTSSRRSLSASRVRAYEQCPAAFRHRHVDGLPDPVGQAARVGVACHAALERAAAGRFDGVAEGPACATEALTHLATVDPTLLKGEAEWAECAEVLKAGAPYEFGEQLLEPESTWELQLAPEVSARGIWDLTRLRRLDGGAEAVDYKCGPSVPLSREEAKYSPQVGLYLVALHEAYPDAPSWTCTLHYVRHGERVSVQWSPALDRYHRARALAVEQAWHTGYFPATPSERCRYCPFRTFCDDYQKTLKGADAGAGVPEDPSDLLEERIRVSGLLKLLEGRKKDLDAAIRGLMGSQTGLETDEAVARLRSRRTKTVSARFLPLAAEQLGKNVSEVVANLASVSATKAKALAGDNPELLALLDEHTTTKTATWLEVKERPA